MTGYLTREEQLRKACKIFAVARQRSRYYGEKYENLGEMQTYEDWLKVPFMTHEALYNHTYPRSLAMLTAPVEGMVVTSTGGPADLRAMGSSPMTNGMRL